MTCPPFKMKQKLGTLLKAGDYVMIDDCLTLILVSDAPYLVISRFANGRHGPREVHRIVQNGYYFVPSPEFVHGLGASKEAEVAAESDEVCVLANEEKVLAELSEAVDLDRLGSDLRMDPSEACTDPRM